MKEKKVNLTSKVIIEEILDTEDILCTIDIRHIDTTLKNALLTLQDLVIQTWTI